MTICPAEMAAPIEMPVEMWSQVGPRSHVLEGVGSPDPPREVASQTPPNIVPSGPDIEIPGNDVVNQCSDWPAT